MERIAPQSKCVDWVLYVAGTIAIFLLYIVDIGYYRYDIEIPNKVLTLVCVWASTFLYMSYEYFRTERMFEELQNRIKELENEVAKANS